MAKPTTQFYTNEKIQHQAEIFSNRLQNRFAHFGKKFRKQGVECFRLYDWDIPEVRAVVDWYAGHAVIAEYVREQTGLDWLPKMADAAAAALGIPREQMHMKERRTNTKEGARYSRMNTTNQRIEVKERDLRFWVNLDDFLDTGLYSDHRDTRVLVRNLAKGKDFLNLYAYTGAFTCAAAAGGAKTTTMVDRSATYLAWAKENLQLNNLWGDGIAHELVQSDVDKFLAQTQRQGKKFTLGFIDPPSFFQDKERGISFDINKDHPELLRNVLKIMAPGSTLFFSTNHQRFEPQLDKLPVKDLKELTPKTIPEDYRNKTIHRCWQMTAC